MRNDPPIYQRVLQPHRSLSLPGFRRVILFTAAGLSVSLMPVLGSPVGWALLPFLLGALLALYAALQRNYRDAALREEVRVWPDLITVDRIPPRGEALHWDANPHWVTATLHSKARIESYLTLRGNGREIELGAFLSPTERVDLHAELTDLLRRPL
ncbi:MAG: DUF2244 domain-containing protein [Pseudomonadota bacterium]